MVILNDESIASLDLELKVRNCWFSLEGKDDEMTLSSLFAAIPKLNPLAELRPHSPPIFDVEEHGPLNCPVFCSSPGFVTADSPQLNLLFPPNKTISQAID